MGKHEFSSFHYLFLTLHKQKDIEITLKHAKLHHI